MSTAAVAAVLVVGGLSACGDSKDDAKSTALDQTTVSGGSDTEAPKVEVKPKPLTVTETQTRVLEDGDGPVVCGFEPHQEGRLFQMMLNEDAQAVAPPAEARDPGLAAKPA